MEDLIYLILALLWLVFSVSKARQKPGPKPETAAEPKPKTSWEQMLEELLPPELEVEEEAPFGRPVASATETASPTPLETDFSPYESYNTLDYQDENTIPEIVSLEESAPEGPVLLKTMTWADHQNEHSQQRDPRLLIELRRAIVYNAILERPAWMQH